MGLPGMFESPGFEKNSEIYFSESLILAQSERWRRGSDMQVEREPLKGNRMGGQRRTGA